MIRPLADEHKILLPVALFSASLQFVVPSVEGKVLGSRGARS